MQNQAQLLSYVDAFKVLTIGAGIMFFLAFVMRKNDPRAGGDVAVG
jgi:DHA2 family multidrug resistance protein